MQTQSEARRDFASRPRTLAMRRDDMVQSIVRLTQERGSACEADLKRAGFSADEIAAFGEDATAEAGRRLGRAVRA